VAEVLVLVLVLVFMLMLMLMLMLVLVLVLVLIPCLVAWPQIVREAGPSMGTLVCTSGDSSIRIDGNKMSTGSNHSFPSAVVHGVLLTRGACGSSTMLWVRQRVWRAVVGLCFASACGEPSCVCVLCVAGKWYYEIVLTCAALAQLGWGDVRYVPCAVIRSHTRPRTLACISCLTHTPIPQSHAYRRRHAGTFCLWFRSFGGASKFGIGCGDDLSSWAFDGNRVLLWHEGRISWGKKWRTVRSLPPSPSLAVHGHFHRHCVIGGPCHFHRRFVSVVMCVVSCFERPALCAVRAVATASPADGSPSS
jgi:hypothetical protein